MSQLKVNKITDLQEAEIFQPNLMTAQAATGTAVDFVGIPSWAKRITVTFASLSTNGSSIPIIRLGTTSGIETTGYLGTAGFVAAASAASVIQTAGLAITNSMAATGVLHGSATFTRVSDLLWVGNLMAGWSNQATVSFGGTSKTLSATLDRIRITIANGTDQFDLGTIGVMYE